MSLVVGTATCSGTNCASELDELLAAGRVALRPPGAITACFGLQKSGYHNYVQMIVVGYDGSDAAERALGRAAELAEALAARLVVVSVFGLGGLSAPELEGIPLPLPLGGPLPGGGTMPVPEPEPESTRKLEELAQRQLERARRTLSGRRLEADYVARVGSPAETLLDVADEREADLVVVGSREHGLLERLLARPVDEAVAQRAGRDVLLVQ